MLTFGYDLEATGPNPFQNKVITIQYRRNNQNHVFKIWDYENSERNLLLSFLNDWKDIPRHLQHGGDYFVTYNLRLDAPFLLTRCLLNDLDRISEWRNNLWSILIHAPDFLDLYQVLGDKLTSYEEWRKMFGLPVGRFRNSEIPQMYKEQHYSEIEEYVDDELLNLEKMYYSITKEPFFMELEKLRTKLKV